MQSAPDLAVLASLLALFAVIAASFFGNDRAKGSNRWRHYKRSYGPRLAYDRDARLTQSNRVPDAADQLRALERADFGKQPLLRHQESKVFAAAERAVREAGLSWRIFAQVSLGEVLTCHDREGFSAINAKRVDLLIADADFTPIAAIEYQGAGHHKGPAAARDAVKREALRKAGIGYIEITQDHGPQDVRREISRLAFAKRRAPSDQARRA